MPEYKSGGQPYNITFYPGPASTKTYPGVVLLHGNGAFRPPFGDQIHDFAETLAKLGYVTAVPGYYLNDNPPPIPPLQNMDKDPGPHVQKLADAIAELSKRKDVDPNRLGLIGYSLGAAVAMRYIAKNPGKASVFADFFGPINSTIEAGAGTFPPTIISHTDNDELVFPSNSEKLNKLLIAGKIQSDLKTYPSEGQFMDHPFKPGGDADEDSRKRLIQWFDKYLPPKGT